MYELLLNTFTWMVIGFIVAYIAHLCNLDSRRGGVISTIIFGLVGAVSAGVLANIFLGKTIPGVSIPGLVIAGIAVLLLACLQAFLFRNKKSRYDHFTYIS